MARRKAQQVKEDLIVNLVPMVDIMFLLLLFFMLGADMSQREQAELVLPTASEIKENEKVKTEEPTTTVNIQHSDSVGNCPINTSGGICREEGHWAVVIRGREIPRETLKEQIKTEADASLEPDIDPIAQVRLSARKIIIRADKSAPYGDVNKIIEYAGTAGIYKIEVGAAVPPKG